MKMQKMMPVPAAIIAALTLLSLMTVPVMAQMTPPTRIFAFGVFTTDENWTNVPPGHKCMFILMIGCFEGDGEPPGPHSGDPCSGWGMFWDMTAGKMWLLKVTYWKWGWSTPPDDILVGGTATALDCFRCMGSIHFELRLYRCCDSTCIDFMDIPENFLYWNQPSGNGCIIFCH